jgi:hypothetical protein
LGTIARTVSDLVDIESEKSTELQRNYLVEGVRRQLDYLIERDKFPFALIVSNFLDFSDDFLVRSPLHDAMVDPLVEHSEKGFGLALIKEGNDVRHI